MIMPAARNTMCAMADEEGYRDRCGIFFGVLVCLARASPFDRGLG
jgi:hypothetical protein